MAIYHCSTKTVNRSSGRTAVASSAYRAGEKLKDERTGLTHDFTRKDGVAHSEIISNLDIEIDRNELWNLAEKTENRKDARTAREWVIALPDELDPDQRKDLAKDFARSLVDRYGVIADLAIHEPSKGGNDKNHHAHIMLTTRKAELDPENKLTLTTKTDIELSNAKRKSLDMGTTQEDIKQIRETWADLANKALERAGYREKIDHRSYADQNNGLQATIHEPSKGGNDKNHHAHIMLTTRKAELDTDKKLTLTTKTDIELSNAKRKSLGMGTTQEDIKQIRETWADLANKALERAGYREKIDHRSYADQNNGLQATLHEGTKVTQLRRQGIDTEISRFNDNVKQQNTQQLDQQKQQKESVLQSGLNRVDQGFEQWQKNQASKRLELERQAEMKRQQELDKQRAEQANRKASRDLDNDGWSR